MIKPTIINKLQSKLQFNQKEEIISHLHSLNIIILLIYISFSSISMCLAKAESYPKWTTLTDDFSMDEIVNFATEYADLSGLVSACVGLNELAGEDVCRQIDITADSEDNINQDDRDKKPKYICRDTELCLIYCTTDNNCDDIQIASLNYSVLIFGCIGEDSCDSIKINADEAFYLHIVGGNSSAMEYSDIHCPHNNHNHTFTHDHKHAHCSILGHCTDKDGKKTLTNCVLDNKPVFSDVTIHANDGLYDVNLECDAEYESDDTYNPYDDDEMVCFDDFIILCKDNFDPDDTHTCYLDYSNEVSEYICNGDAYCQISEEEYKYISTTTGSYDTGSIDGSTTTSSRKSNNTNDGYESGNDGEHGFQEALEDFLENNKYTSFFAVLLLILSCMCCMFIIGCCCSRKRNKRRHGNHSARCKKCTKKSCFCYYLWCCCCCNCCSFLFNSNASSKSRIAIQKSNQLHNVSSNQSQSKSKSNNNTSQHIQVTTITQDIEPTPIIQNDSNLYPQLPLHNNKQKHKKKGWFKSSPKHVLSPSKSNTDPGSDPGASITNGIVGVEMVDTQNINIYTAGTQGTPYLTPPIVHDGNMHYIQYDVNGNTIEISPVHNLHDQTPITIPINNLINQISSSTMSNKTNRIRTTLSDKSTNTSTGATLTGEDNRQSSNSVISDKNLEKKADEILSKTNLTSKYIPTTITQDGKYVDVGSYITVTNNGNTPTTPSTPSTNQKQTTQVNNQQIKPSQQQININNNEQKQDNKDKDNIARITLGDGYEFPSTMSSSSVLNNSKQSTSSSTFDPEDPHPINAEDEYDGDTISYHHDTNNVSNIDIEQILKTQSINRLSQTNSDFK